MLLIFIIIFAVQINKLMKKTEIAMYQMQRVVVEKLLVNANVWGSIVGANEIMSKLDSNIKQIDLSRQIQELSIKGVSQNKQLLKDELTEVALEVGRKTLVYAKMKGDEVLAEEVGYCRSDYLLARDTVVRDIAAVVVKCAEDVVAELADYGVNEALLAKARLSIERYAEVIAEPRLAQVRRKEATRRIGALLEENRLLLKDLDLLMELMRFENAGFYGEYRNTRKVILMGRVRLSLKLRVVDEATGLGVVGAKVRVFDEDGDEVMLKVTYSDGGFYVRNMAEGKYRAEVSKPGFEVAVREFFVADGDMCKVVVGLQGA